MATEYLVKLSVTLTPVHHCRPVTVALGINNNLTTTSFEKTTTVNFEFASNQSCELMMELVDKQDQEAVIVESVSFFGIKDPKFAWAGIYRPVYPEPWASQQRAKGIQLAGELSPHTYLGWPGKWTLTFTVPVFTWIHQTQNLGWIYG